MQKNVAGQKVIVFAFDATTNLPKTGDAANITAYLSKDFGAVTVLGDTSATEMDATNAKGYYLFDLTQTESNADVLGVTGKSSTANVVVIGAPAVIFTTAPNFTAAAIDSNGRFDLSKILGTAVTEGGAGRLAGAFTKLFDIAVPVLTAASVNQTGDNFARLGAPAGASLAADIAAIKTVVDTISGYVDTEVAAILGFVDTEVAAIKAVTDQMVFGIANALNANITGVNSSTTAIDRFAEHIKGVLKGLTTAGGTTTTVVANASTGINGAAPSATNDFYTGRVIVFTSGALAGQACAITAYNGGTQTFTVSTLTGAPASGVSFIVV